MLADQRSELLTRLQQMLPQWQHFAQAEVETRGDMAKSPARGLRTGGR